MNTPARNFGRYEMLGDETNSTIVLKNCMHEELYFFPVSSLTRSAAMMGPTTNGSSPTVLSTGARSSLPTSNQLEMTVENQKDRVLPVSTGLRGSLLHYRPECVQAVVLSPTRDSLPV